METQTNGEEQGFKDSESAYRGSNPCLPAKHKSNKLRAAMWLPFFFAYLVATNEKFVEVECLRRCRLGVQPILTSPAVHANGFSGQLEDSATILSYQHCPVALCH